MTDSEKELVSSLRNRAENALQEGTATAQADAWHFTQSADAIERLSAQIASLLNELNVTNTLREIANNGLGEFEEEVRRLERERDEAMAERDAADSDANRFQAIAIEADNNKMLAEAEVARLREENRKLNFALLKAQGYEVMFVNDEPVAVSGNGEIMEAKHD